MPRQGGQGKGKPKKHERDFGRALIKQQVQGSKGFLGTKLAEGKNMSSILENNALDDYINMVEMDSHEVEVRRYADEAEDVVTLVEAEAASKAQTLSNSSFSQEQLVIPRKPEWSFEMSAEEVDQNEKQAFLQWRRRIADLERHSNDIRRITPFEKNIEVWRQLWRVCERSHFLIQVVDARNPLLYYTADLVNYLSELRPPRRMALLVNKSDLLSPTQRAAWKAYFESKNIRFLFYSAYFEQSKLDQGQDDEDEAELDFDALVDTLLEEDGQASNDSLSLLTRKDLFKLFETLSQRIPRDNSKPFCVGMVGYPNVGKSSCINTLLGVTKSNHGKVRVGVSATPGKTKHFQTISLSKDLVLCDCPGLVFPSFMRSAGEMLCSGILPINQMRDCIDPISIICARVPRHHLEATYGIRIERQLDFLDNPHRPPTGTELLAAYCKVKGYITGGTGRWDDFRAAKEILRDFNDGRLLYVAIPPGEVMYSLDQWLHETESTVMKREKIADRVNKIRTEQNSMLAAEVEAMEGDPSEHDSADFTEGYEFVSEDPQDPVLDLDSDPNMKREHKRLKHWGKKNRKLRNKTPYDDDNNTESFIVHVKNRVPGSIGSMSSQYRNSLMK